jgi:hypothetical protein
VLADFGLSATDLGPERTYQWRVRAAATEPDLQDTYPWGPTWTFLTQPAPPGVMPFSEEHCPDLSVIYDREIFEPGATQYDYEYQPIPVGTAVQELDTVTPLDDKMQQTWLQADFAEQTATYESLTHTQLPPGQIALPLPGTVCDQAHYAYRGRYRVWKGANCSQFTSWWLFWDLSGTK